MGGGSAIVPSTFKRAMVVSYRPSSAQCAISNRSAASNLPLSASSTQIDRGGGHFGPKSGEEAVDRCKSNFNRIRERHGAVVARRTVSVSSVV